MEGNLDWRSFGSITYNEMKEVGLFDALKKKTVDFMKARTNASSKDLLLSEAGSRQLDQKMRVIKAMLDGIERDPSGGVTSLISNIETWHEVSIKHIRHWTLDFIRGFGVFTNHSYKNRVSSGIIRDIIITLTLMARTLSKPNLGSRSIGLIEAIPT